jgi:hypothetical protein
MNPPDDINAVLGELAALVRPPLLVGGWALALLGVDRQTFDVDLMIADDDMGVVDAVLRRHGYAKAVQTAMFAKYQAPARQDVDVLFVDAASRQTLHDRGTDAVFGGVRVRVPHLSDMIAMKLHAVKHNPALRRAKDLPDILALMRLAGYNSESPEFIRLCERYGNSETQACIRTLLGEVRPNE